VWAGPVPNQGPPLMSHRGLVVHIAQGSYEGTIAWAHNPESQVSSHFVAARDGRVAQLVDTDIQAWTQKAGNDEWLSVECEGFQDTPLTDRQLDSIARLLVRAHGVYLVPLIVATDPNGFGLGHHSMGGVAWGHLDCPGPLIIAQKPSIVLRAKAFANGDDMQLTDRLPDTADDKRPEGYTVGEVLSQGFASLNQGKRLYGPSQTHDGGLPFWYAPAEWISGEIARQLAPLYQAAGLTPPPALTTPK